MSASPVVVGGAGAAGLATALAAAPAPVLLLARDGGAGGASALAQGGIAAALGEGDDPAAHAADTLLAGAGGNRASLVEWLCREAPATVAWLQAQGVAFDRGVDGGLALGREGGHHRQPQARKGGQDGQTERLHSSSW